VPSARDRSLPKRGQSRASVPDLSAPGGRGIDNHRSMGSRLSYHRIVYDFWFRIVMVAEEENAYRYVRIE
jgi:hypothetical protein